MELPELPARLVIIGAGYIGLEFAAVFASFGAQVTVLDHQATFLPREDDDVAAMVKENLAKLGVEIKMGVAIKKVTDEAGQAVVRCEEQGERARHFG